MNTNQKVCAFWFTELGDFLDKANKLGQEGWKLFHVGNIEQHFTDKFIAVWTAEYVF